MSLCADAVAADLGPRPPIRIVRFFLLFAADPHVVVGDGDGDGDERADAVGFVQGLPGGHRPVAGIGDGIGGDGVECVADCRFGVAAGRDRIGVEYLDHHGTAYGGGVLSGHTGAVHAVFGLWFAGQGSGIGEALYAASTKLRFLFKNR